MFITSRYIYICMVMMTMILSAQEKIRRGGRRFRKSGRVSQMFEYYKAGKDVIKHGKEVHYYDMPERDGKRVVKLVLHWDKDVKHGLYTEKYPDGTTIKETGRFEKGNKVGTWRSFYKNGAQHKEAEFKDGELHGTVTEWSSSGQKLSETPYRAGKPHGPARKWHPDGKPKSEWNYNGGKLHGKVVSWYLDGKQKRRAQFKNGDRDGMEKLWADNGNPISEIEYRDGKKQGMVRLWDDKGKLKSEKEYLNAQPHGTWIEYFPSGVVSRKAHYKHGVLDGEEITRLPSGQKRSLITYRAGTPHGRQVRYYQNGLPRKEFIIKAGKKHGPAIYYKQDNTILAKGVYRFDEEFEGSFVIENPLIPNRFHVVTYKAGELIDFVLYTDGKLANGLVKTVNPQTEKLMSKCHYLDGMKHGLEEIYHSNGKLGRKLTWFKNQPDGLVQHWHKKGAKIWEAQYDKGQKNGYEKAWDLEGKVLIDGVYKDGQPWNGTLFGEDPKTKNEIILVYNDGQQVKKIPDRLKNLFSDEDSQLLIKGNVERIPWKNLKRGNSAPKR